MKTRFTATIGDKLYIAGRETIVRSNRQMGNHKWITDDEHKPHSIILRLAQAWLDDGKATFYRKTA